MKAIRWYVPVLMTLPLVMSATADIIYSDLNDILIPTDFDGVYLDVDGKVWGTSEGSVSGWDINPFFGGVGVASAPDLQPVRTGTAAMAPLANFAVGGVISSGSVFTTAYGGTGYGGSSSHVAATGADPVKFAAGAEGYLGFKLNNGAGGWNYGWMRVVFNGDDSVPARIRDWAYDNSGSAIVIGRVRQDVPVNGTQLVTLSPKTGEYFTLGSLITNTGDNVNSVVKTEAGSVTLTGANSYTGTTSITGGRLLVNGSILSNDAVSVSSGATLGGTGSISGPVNVSGVLAPGASVETLYSGALAMNDGSHFQYEMDSGVALGLGADLQRVTGNLSFNGAVYLDLTDLASSPLAFEVGTKFSLINYTGSWNNGVFTYDSVALANGAVFNAGLNTWQISYNATSGGSNFTGEYLSGNFVNLAVVPETGAALLGGLGLLTLLRRRRGVSWRSV